MTVPDHMNILTVEEAETHVSIFLLAYLEQSAEQPKTWQLQCSTWARNKLQDASMLPLGIGVSFI